jgi:hypothetical protein
MLGSPGSGQGFDDGGFIGLAAGLAEGSQHLRVSFPGDNGPQDEQPGQAGDVRQDVMELEVHLLQGLLHMQDMRGSMLDQFSPVA